MKSINPDNDAFRRAVIIVNTIESGAPTISSDVDVSEHIFIASRGLVNIDDPHKRPSLGHLSDDGYGPRFLDHLCIAASVAITQGWGEREGAGVIAARMDACVDIQFKAAALLLSAEKHARGYQNFMFKWLVPDLDRKASLSDAHNAEINRLLSDISSSPERQASLLARAQGRFADLAPDERDEVFGQIASAETSDRGIQIIKDFEVPAKVDPTVRYDELQRNCAKTAVAMATWPRADIVDRLRFPDPDKEHRFYEDARLPYRRHELEMTIMEKLVEEVTLKDDQIYKVSKYQDSNPETIGDSFRMIEEARGSFSEGVPSHLQPPSMRSDHPVPLPSSASYSMSEAYKMLFKAAEELDLWSDDSLWESGAGSHRLLISEVNVALTISDHTNKFSFIKDRTSHEYSQDIAIGEQMKRGDFSRMEENLRKVREVASWMAPMLSRSTRKFLGVGQPVEQSIVYGIMVNARRGLEVDTMKERALDATKNQAIAAIMAASRSL